MSDQFSLTEADALGDLLSEFESKSDKLRFFLPTVFLIIGLSFSLLILLTSMDGLFIFVFLFFVVALVGTSSYAIVQNFREGNWQVQVFTQGMVVTSKGKNKLMRWSEINSVKRRNIMSYSFGEGNGIPLGTYCVYTIQMQNGEKCTFSGIKVEQLGNLIYRQWKPGT